jgi:hypothetical protein
MMDYVVVTFQSQCQQIVKADVSGDFWECHTNSNFHANLYLLPVPMFLFYQATFDHTAANTPYLLRADADFEKSQPFHCFTNDYHQPATFSLIHLV